MKFPGTRNFPTLYKLSEKLLEVTPQDTKLIKLYWSHLFDIHIVRQFLVNQPLDK